MTKTLVLDYRALVNVGELVIRHSMQHAAVSADFEAPIWVFPHVDVAADQPAIRCRVIEQPEYAVVQQRQRIRYLTLYPPSQNRVEILVIAQRPVGRRTRFLAALRSARYRPP